MASTQCRIIGAFTACGDNCGSPVACPTSSANSGL
jgi:hypothetical protein